MIEQIHIQITIIVQIEKIDACCRAFVIEPISGGLFFKCSRFGWIIDEKFLFPVWIIF